MQLVTLLIISLFFLIGTAFLTAFNSAFRKVHREDPKIKELGKRFFYRHIHLFFFPDHQFEGIYFATISALNITRFFYAVSAVLFILSIPLMQNPIVLLLTFFGFVLIGFIFGDFFPRLIGTRFSETVLKVCSFVSSVFMLFAFPITFVCMKMSGSVFESVYLDHLHEPIAQTKKEIMDIVQKAEVTPEMTLHDKELITSVLRFKDRIVREIMVPRVDIFGLSVDTTIRESAKMIEEEGYSRIPVYKNSLDEIQGILLYKDVINKFMEYEASDGDDEILDAPISSILTPALYCPETKKISNLLLEFKGKQKHLAIVVDEYGGTEGIATIEDILEEIVGEIADEYDTEEDLFQTLADGSWVLDARMGILDIEEQLGVKIPQEGDYDTVGGYIFHCAGAIPKRGFIIHQDEFEVEVMRSNDRCVEKVRLKPVYNEEVDQES